MPIREYHVSKVPRTVWAHFRFFGGLKKRFLPSCVTHGSRGRSFFWAHFRHLGASMCYFCQVVDHAIQTYLAFCELIFCISVSQKFFFSRVVEHNVQGYLDSCELIFYSFASWKSDFWQVLKSTINVYLTRLLFGVRVHPTDFPFKSLRVSDNKRLYLVNRRWWNNEIT